MNQKQRTAEAEQGHPLPRVRSFTSYLMRGAALVLVLSVVGLPVNFALGGNSNSTVSVLLEVGEIFSLLFLVIAALAHRGEKKAIRRIVLATWHIRSRKVTIKTKDEETKTAF